MIENATILLTSEEVEQIRYSLRPPALMELGLGDEMEGKLGITGAEVDVEQMKRVGAKLMLLAGVIRAVDRGEIPVGTDRLLDFLAQCERESEESVEHARVGHPEDLAIAQRRLAVVRRVAGRVRATEGGEWT
jgi:hypothetical protein